MRQRLALLGDASLDRGYNLPRMMRLDCPILERFDALHRGSPRRPLVREAEVLWTVAEIDGLAQHIAPALDGLPAATAVALCCRGGAPFLAAFLALRRTGHAALLVDPTSPSAEQHRLAIALGAAASLAVDLRGGASVPGAAADVTVQRAAELPTPHPGLAVIKLTSGSTGTPRGVATPAAALVADVLRLQAAMGITPDDCLLAAVPMSFSYGLSSVALPALLCGNEVVVPTASPLGPMHPTGLAHAHVVPTTPAIVHAMSRLGAKWTLPDTVRLVLAAGSPLRAAHARAFRARFGRAAHVLYGASECGGIAYDPTGIAAERGTVGAVLAGVDVRVDSEGCLAIRSDAVAAGYLSADPNGTQLGDGVFHSGDFGALRGDELALLGRRIDRVVLGGREVDLAEIERVLLMADGIEDACVIAGDGGGSEGYAERGVCRAFVTAARPASVEPHRLLAFCRTQLAPHKVPRSLHVVEQIPRTGRGKPDRAALAAAARMGTAR